MHNGTTEERFHQGDGHGLGDFPRHRERSARTWWKRRTASSHPDVEDLASADCRAHREHDHQGRSHTHESHRSRQVRLGELGHHGSSLPDARELHPRCRTQALSPQSQHLLGESDRGDGEGWLPASNDLGSFGLRGEEPRASEAIPNRGSRLRLPGQCPPLRGVPRQGRFRA